MENFTLGLLAAIMANEPSEVTKYLQQRTKSWMDEISKMIIPEKEEFFVLAAAYKLLGNSMYSTLNGKEKELCDTLVNSAVITVIVQPKQSSDE